jgi:hypothetical protein
MKALTLWQPWAMLMAVSEKKVETRSWATKYRGPIAIHSALTIPRWLGEPRKSQEFNEALMAIVYKHSTELVKGSILCVADLVSIEETTKVRADLSPQELLFGNYEDGRYAWFFENIRRLESPYRCKGNRMLWNVDADPFLAQIGAVHAPSIQDRKR